MFWVKHNEYVNNFIVHVDDNAHLQYRIFFTYLEQYAMGRGAYDTTGTPKPPPPPG
jgi:hypothetical protein